jgi:drug/metabolite transporter (DMT)-like permease
MSMFSIALVLLSAAIHVGWNFMAKSSPSPRVFSLLAGTYIILLTLLLLPFIPFSSIPAGVWLCVGVSGIIHSIYMWALSTAYETGDLSFVYPIMRSAPAFVPIAAFFIIDETLSPRGTAGVVIVVVCVFLSQLRGSAGSEFHRMGASLRQKDSLWAFVALAAVVGYTLVDKTAMVRFHNVKEIRNGLHGPIYFLLQNTIWSILFWVYMGLHHRERILPFWRRERFRAAVAMVGMTVSYTLILHVMQTEEVSYIVTLRQSSVLLAVLAGGVFLKETFLLRRTIAAVFMMVGFYFVATAN